MKKRNLIPWFLLIASILILSFSIVYAWYVFTNRKAEVEEIEIETPPLIYIRDDNMNEMTSFNLAGLEKGTEYNFIFCVVPTKKNAAVSFQLAVAYTENLHMDINLYPVNEVTSTQPTSSTYLERVLYDKVESSLNTFYFAFNKASWSSIPEVKKANGVDAKEDGQNPNDGTRKTYKNIDFSTTAPAETGTYLDELNDQRNYRFFVMNITWPETIDSTSYEKEVDLIYIISKGQPKVS